MPTLSFYDDPAAFLGAGGDWFAADPVGTNVITVYTDRLAREGVAEGVDHWWVLVREGERIVGAAMRTAPFEPRPLWVAPMPEEAAVLLARTLHARGEHPGGANGALPAARVVAEESARLWGGRVEIAMATRLWELGTLARPAGVRGHARPASYDDLDVCLAWFNDFGRAAREQAGNAESAQGEEHHERGDIERRIADRRILLWEVDGEVVHLTGFSWPVLGVGRIAPVYTPKEHRGHGYAGAAVVAASQRILDVGGRVCLFTDRDNPVSNHLYARLGFRPLVDMANHTLT